MWPWQRTEGWVASERHPPSCCGPLWPGKSGEAAPLAPFTPGPGPGLGESSFISPYKQAAIYNILTHSPPKPWAHISVTIMIIMTHRGKTE